MVSHSSVIHIHLSICFHLNLFNSFLHLRFLVLQLSDTILLLLHSLVLRLRPYNKFLCAPACPCSAALRDQSN